MKKYMQLLAFLIALMRIGSFLPFVSLCINSCLKFKLDSLLNYTLFFFHFQKFPWQYKKQNVSKYLYVSLSQWKIIGIMKKVNKKSFSVKKKTREDKKWEMITLHVRYVKHAVCITWSSDFTFTNMFSNRIIIDAYVFYMEQCVWQHTNLIMFNLSLFPLTL